MKADAQERLSAVEQDLEAVISFFFFFFPFFLFLFRIFPSFFAFFGGFLFPSRFVTHRIPLSVELVHVRVLPSPHHDLMNQQRAGVQVILHCTFSNYLGS